MASSVSGSTRFSPTARSVERGAFGSPTFFVGDEIYFGKDRLRDVEAAIMAVKQVPQ